MLAIVAAIVFGLAFLIELLDVSIGISIIALVALGLCLLALHQAGVGNAGWRTSWRGRARARR
jgi:hypothetical protein